jgi:response regulator RpfG family c-di-GMP phosphodiesterase
MDGRELLQRLVKLRPEVPVLILTGHGTLEEAVRALRNGAYDFLTKPVDPQLIFPTVERALERLRLMVANKRYVEELEETVAARTRQLAALNEIHRYIATCVFSLEEGLAFVLTTIAARLEVDSCAIHLPDQQGGWVARAGVRAGQELTPTQLERLPSPASTEEVGWVAIGAQEGFLQVEFEANRDPAALLAPFVEPIRLIIKFGVIFAGLPKAEEAVDVKKLLADIETYEQGRMRI